MGDLSCPECGGDGMPVQGHDVTCQECGHTWQIEAHDVATCEIECCQDCRDWYVDQEADWAVDERIEHKYRKRG